MYRLRKTISYILAGLILIASLPGCWPFKKGLKFKGEVLDFPTNISNNNLNLIFYPADGYAPDSTFIRMKKENMYNYSFEIKSKNLKKIFNRKKFMPGDSILIKFEQYRDSKILVYELVNEKMVLIDSTNMSVDSLNMVTCDFIQQNYDQITDINNVSFKRIRPRYYGELKLSLYDKSNNKDLKLQINDNPGMGEMTNCRRKNIYVPTDD